MSTSVPVAFDPTEPPEATDPMAPAGFADQGHVFDTDGDVELGTDDWSRSVTTGRAGQLAGIELQIDTAHPEGVDVGFAVFAGANPTSGTALFSEQLTITTEEGGRCSPGM